MTAEVGAVRGPSVSGAVMAVATGAAAWIALLTKPDAAVGPWRARRGSFEASSR